MLTAIQSNSNLAMPLPLVRDGIGVPNVAAQPHSCGFFVPNAQLSIMAGWAEQLSSWPVATQVRQLRSVCLQMIGVVWGWVFNLFSGVAIMLKNHTQELTKTTSPTLNIRLKSLFTLLSANREIIAEHLTFDQAKPLSEHINGSVIKFDRMGGVL